MKPQAERSRPDGTQLASSLLSLLVASEVSIRLIGMNFAITIIASLQAQCCAKFRKQTASIRQDPSVTARGSLAGLRTLHGVHSKGFRATEAGKLPRRLICYLTRLPMTQYFIFQITPENDVADISWAWPRKNPESGALSLARIEPSNRQIDVAQPLRPRHVYSVSPSRRRRLAALQR